MRALISVAYNFVTLYPFRLKFSMLEICFRLMIYDLSQNGSVIFEKAARGKYFVLPTLKSSGELFFEKLYCPPILEQGREVWTRGGLSIQDVPFAIPVKICPTLAKL